MAEGGDGAPFAPAASPFLELLLSRNGIGAAAFAAWEFLPGMRFGERAAWWRAGAERTAPHEGLDLRGFRTPAGGSVALGAGTRVPVLWAGDVVAVVADFIGRSVFVAHRQSDGAGRRLHSVYGHLDPPAGLAPGCALRDGDEVGTVADAGRRKVAVPAHLHLTLALIVAGTAPGALDWRTLRDPARALLLDPLPLICGTMRAPARGPGTRATEEPHGS
jgi:hypothetical protein